MPGLGGLKHLARRALRRLVEPAILAGCIMLCACVGGWAGGNMCVRACVYACEYMVAVLVSIQNKHVFLSACAARKQREWMGSGGRAYIVPPPNSDSHARACATDTLASTGNPAVLGSPSRGTAPGDARSLR